MLYPSKHISISESLFGLGAIVLNRLKKKPQTIDDLWDHIRTKNRSGTSSYHGFDNLALSINYLFLIGAIDINSKQELYHATNKT